MLLSRGQVLQQSYIQRILALKYHGVYIMDGMSDDIEIETLVNDELRMAAVAAVRNTFVLSQSQQNIGDAMENTKAVVHRMVDELLSSKDTMVNMIDMKIFDNYTFYHSVNVAILSLLLGVSVGFPESRLYKLGLAALLHDIGKVFITKDVLDKPGPLDTEEMAEMRRHPVYGYEYLRDHSDLPTTAFVGVLHHHEKYDGSGYPYGLRGADISEFGRIIAVADVYDALSSDRPYRRSVLPSEAMEFIMGGSGTHFDPQYVQVFTRKVAAFPLGTIVRLSNGMTAIVVRNFEDCNTRPAVRVLSGELQGTLVNLKNDLNFRSVTITEVLGM